MKFSLVLLMALTIFSLAVLWLWNWLMPAIFGLHTIRFTQALGLLLLGKILFTGFSGRPVFGWGSRMRLIRRWENMTPEEREVFRSRMRAGCGPIGPSPEAPKA